MFETLQSSAGQIQTFTALKCRRNSRYSDCFAQNLCRKWLPNVAFECALMPMRDAFAAQSALIEVFMPDSGASTRMASSSGPLSRHVTVILPRSKPLAVRLGVRLRKLRQERGFTQQQLSDRLGIDRCYLSEIENGRRSISLHIIEVLADGFAISLSELFTHLE